MKSDLRIIGVLMAKNEETFIPELLDQMKVFCDETLVLDGGSTDQTVSIALKKGARCRLEDKADGFHEGRARRYLHYWAAEYKPDWIFAPDADDIFIPDDLPKIREIVKLADSQGINVVQFPYRYLWGDREHYRVDGHYGNLVASKLFRYVYEMPPLNREVHVVPAAAELFQPGKNIVVDVPLLHLGYMFTELRQQKYEYNSKRWPVGSDGWKASGSPDYEHILGKVVEIETL